MIFNNDSSVKLGRSTFEAHMLLVPGLKNLILVHSKLDPGALPAISVYETSHKLGVISGDHDTI